MAFVGVRADESVRRSGYDYISYGTKHRGQYSCNPILAWNSAEVYLYIFANNLHLNEAYKRGNTRAGCLVCPMSTNRNDYLNNRCYNSSTQPLLDIIHDLNSADKGNEERIKSYIENNGWKARKNGRDLSIAPKDYTELIIGKDLVITFKNQGDDWKQWVKTLGRILPTEDSNIVKIEHAGKEYIIRAKEKEDGYCQVSISNESTASNILFLKNVRKIFRKSHYCVGCRVCEANCKFGNLKFDINGHVQILDKCVKCGQCLDIDTGCYVYKSLWLSKGLGNMNKSKSLDSALSKNFKHLNSDSIDNNLNNLNSINYTNSNNNNGVIKLVNMNVNNNNFINLSNEKRKKNNVNPNNSNNFVNFSNLRYNFSYKNKKKNSSKSVNQTVTSPSMKQTYANEKVKLEKNIKKSFYVIIIYSLIQFIYTFSIFLFMMSEDKREKILLLFAVYYLFQIVFSLHLQT